MTVYARTCKRCGAPFEARRPHAHFCTPKCRVYYHLYDQYDAGPAKRDHVTEPADESIGAAVQAARNFTPVIITDHKTVSAIRVERKASDPNLWTVHLPKGSAVAAENIHRHLIQSIDDQLAFTNKLGDQIGEPRQWRRTGSRPTRKA